MAELERERAVLLKNLEEWRKQRMGQFVLIKGDDVVGFFETLDKAFRDGTKRFGLEPFLVEQIAPPNNVNVSFFGARLLVTP